MKILRSMALAAIPLMMLPAQALAQDDSGEEETAAFEFDGEIGVFSDYRFRGVSLSGKDPQLTGEFSISHESGLYAGIWGSNVDLGTGAEELELDLYAGYATDLGGVTLDVGALYYFYPGNDGFDYVEFTGSLATAVGPGEVRVGMAYAPSQGALGNTDNTYVYIAGDLPIGESPLSLHGSLGYEDGAFGDNKKDWLVGVSLDVGSGITATLDYVDTARGVGAVGEPTAVLSLTAAL